MIERSTYSLLDWFGDLGGLYEALYFLGYFVASPAAAMSLKANLLANNFLYVRSKEYENEKEGRKDLLCANQGTVLSLKSQIDYLLRC